MRWARELDDDEPGIDSMSREDLTSVFLIECDDEVARPLKRHWEWIFEEKLCGWCRTPDQWPHRRTFAMFHDWFDIRLVDLIFDLAQGPIVHDD